MTLSKIETPTFYSTIFFFIYLKFSKIHLRKCEYTCRFRRKRKRKKRLLLLKVMVVVVIRKAESSVEEMVPSIRNSGETPVATVHASVATEAVHGGVAVYSQL